MMGIVRLQFACCGVAALMALKCRFADERRMAGKGLELILGASELILGERAEFLA
jgi:hypothetical protein